MNGIKTEDASECKKIKPPGFEAYPGYDYLRNGFIKRLGTILLRAFAHAALDVWNRVCYGMKICGRENLKTLGKEGAVGICNHVHNMDCTMIDLALRKRRTYYLTLEKNFNIPVGGWLIRRLGALPLSSDPVCMAELFREMRKAVKNGSIVQIYPEGELVPYDDSLREFKDGAFRLAAACGAPVLPMAITYREPAGIMRLYRKKPCLTLNILPPVCPPEAKNEKETAELLKYLCRDAISAVCAKAWEDEKVYQNFA